MYTHESACLQLILFYTSRASANDWELVTYIVYLAILVAAGFDSSEIYKKDSAAARVPNNKDIRLVF